MVNDIKSNTNTTMSVDVIKKKMDKSLLFELIMPFVPVVVVILWNLATVMVVGEKTEETMHTSGIAFVLSGMICFFLKIRATLKAMDCCKEYFLANFDVKFVKKCSTSKTLYIISYILLFIPVLNIITIFVVIYNLIVWFSVKNRISEIVYKKNDFSRDLNSNHCSTETVESQKVKNLSTELQANLRVNIKNDNKQAKSYETSSNLKFYKKNDFSRDLNSNHCSTGTVESQKVKNLSTELQANLRVNIKNDNKEAKSYKTSLKLKFYTKADTVELFGYKITNSIFYTCDVQSIKPFVINTNSKPSFENTPPTRLDYWPNYSNLTRSEKGTYIKWLAEGKPYINEIGYAYIYYYGLEYRALIEKLDLKLVLLEVIELVNKFKKLRYGFDFIVYLIFTIKDFSQFYKDFLLNFIRNNETEYLYRKEYNSLIKLLISKEKFEVKFSPFHFSYYNEHNGFSDRKNEILSYYLDKIIENFDENEIYDIKKQAYAYNMAMQENYESKIAEYELIEPSIKLKRLFNKACKIIKEELTQTVKKFDSSSESLTEIEKIAYLPAVLRKKINYSIDNFEFAEKQKIDINTIAQKFKFKIQDKLTLRQSCFIVDACEALGYTLEPNANINQKAYKNDTKVVLYKTQNLEDRISQNYLIASLFMDIGYQIALEDNELQETEIVYIDNYIQNEFNLSASEKLRLKMKSELLVHTKEINTTGTIKKLISSLDDAGKEKIAQYMIFVAMADGIVKDKELKVLHKIFKQFDLSEEYLNSTLSKLIDKNDEVVIVEKGKTTNKKGSRIPPNVDTQEKIEFKLDIKKLEKIKTNTSEIQNVLQDIFADEQAQELKIEPTESNSVEDTENSELENELQSIINIIIGKEAWTRNELLSVIQGKGLMLGSLVESINEWSEEKYGDFLIEEDDDTYMLNPDVVSLMKRGK